MAKIYYENHADLNRLKGKKVAVIGGGNSGVEAAIDLAGIVGYVTLIEYNDQLKADKILVNKLRSLPNVTIMTGVQTQAILGDQTKVTRLQYLNRQTHQSLELAIDGVFIQIGLIPNSEFVKGLVATNPQGQIIIDHKCRTNIKGIYAAGDVTNVPFNQIIIAMGEGAKASLAVFEDLMLKPTD